MTSNQEFVQWEPAKRGPRPKLYSYNGEDRTLSEIADDIGVHPMTIYQRMRRGISLQEAIELPKNQGTPKCVFEVDGEEKGLTELSEEYDVELSTLWKRVFKWGYSIEDALNPDRIVPKYEYNGKMLSMKELQDVTGLSSYTIRTRLKSGESLDSPGGKWRGAAAEGWELGSWYTDLEKQEHHTKYVSIQLSYILDGKVIDKEANGSMRKSKPLSSLYLCWRNFNVRCTNPNNPMYRFYGEKGITVSDDWDANKHGMAGFHRFITDVGPKPTPKSVLGRKDCSKGYDITNCEWTVQKKQIKRRDDNREENQTK